MISKFPELSNYTSVNFTNNDFTAKLASTIGDVASIKSNTKPYLLDAGRKLTDIRASRRPNVCLFNLRPVFRRFVAVALWVKSSVFSLSPVFSLWHYELKTIHKQDKAHKRYKGSDDNRDNEKFKEARPKSKKIILSNEIQCFNKKNTTLGWTFVKLWNVEDSPKEEIKTFLKENSSFNFKGKI